MLCVFTSEWDMYIVYVVRLWAAYSAYAGVGASSSVYHQPGETAQVDEDGRGSTRSHTRGAGLPHTTSSYLPHPTQHQNHSRAEWSNPKTNAAAGHRSAKDHWGMDSQLYLANTEVNS